MSPNESNDLFRTETPVGLPSEQNATQGRRLLSVIAVGMLLVGLASGLLYRELYQDAGDDVTRLLPASTRLFTRISKPRTELRKVLTLDRWQDPERLSASLQTRGLLSGRTTGEFLGLPLSLIRRTVYSVDDAHFAVVPTPSTMATVGFLQVRDPWASQRLRAGLGAFLEPVDRVLGFDIEAYRGLSDLLPWEDPRLPVRVVDISPNLVITAGPEEAIENVLEARVSGLSQPLATRDGFNRDAARWSDGFWLHATPGALYDLLSRTQSDGEQALGPWRINLRRLFNSVTMSSQVEALDEVFAIDLRMTEGRAANPLRRLGDGGSHSLLDHVPPTAPWVASFSLADPSTAHRSIHGLLETLAGLIEEGPALPIIEAALLLFGTAEPAGVPSGGRGFRGQWIAYGAPGDSDLAPWTILTRVENPARALAQVEVFSLSLFGAGHAYGHIDTPSGETVHVVYPHEVTPSADASGEVLAWRLQNDILTIAPSLRDLRAKPVTGPGLRQTARGQRALRSLPDRSPILFMARPSIARGLAGPLVDRVIDALAPDFLWAVTAVRRGETLQFRTNIGFWSAALLAGGASLSELDDLLLDNISPGCRRALDAMCNDYPNARPCQPLHPDRKRLTEQACLQLRL